jgi:hypothetical protein
LRVFAGSTLNLVEKPRPARPWTGAGADRISVGMNLGTRLFTYFRGELVGKDATGNLYYQERARKASAPAALDDVRRRDRGSDGGATRMARLAALYH